MQIRFRSRTGQIVQSRVLGASRRGDLRPHDLAQSELAGFYEWGDHAFWPKPGFRHNAPQIAEVLDDTNASICVYAIGDLVRDRKKHLTSRPD